jgi:hypothetical protein
MEQTTKDHLKDLKSKDRKIHHTSKNIMNVVANLNSIICHVFNFFLNDLLLHTLLLLNSSQAEKLKINIHMVIDNDESQLKVF